MENIIKKIELYKKGIMIVVGIIGLIISVYKIIENNNKQLELIQKTTLRTMIWSEGVPLRDKIEACDNYLSLGYNSETKMYCEKLLKREFE